MRSLNTNIAPILYFRYFLKQCYQNYSMTLEKRYETVLLERTKILLHSYLHLYRGPKMKNNALLCSLQCMCASYTLISAI